MRRTRTLTRDAIVDAALELVDETGPAGLTMRSLATRLGVEAASLYHHVPSKGALLAALVDTVAERAVATAPTDGSWPDRLRALGYGLRAALLAHPGVMPIVATHPVSPTVGAAILGPVVEAMAADGIDAGAASHAVQAVAVFVIGHALAQAGTPSDGDDTGPDPADGGYYDAWFDAGLDAMISGFEVRLGRGTGSLTASP